MNPNAVNALFDLLGHNETIFQENLFRIIRGRQFIPMFYIKLYILTLKIIEISYSMLHALRLGRCFCTQVCAYIYIYI